MKTLKLFNAVLAKPTKEINPFISDEGFIIAPQAMWAKDQIIDFYLREKLNGNDLNKTFHKSWLKIKESSRFELYIDQIIHYISTYGSDFKDEIYIPNEILDVPDTKLKYKVIRALTKDELISECFLMLNSGIALKEETINDILTILVDTLKYTFTGNEKIKNKEATIKIADLYGVYPSDTMEFFRYVIYRATGQSLLIKNREVIAAIKNGNYNPSAAFNKFGLEKLAEVFNRFKPLFLAFKKICPSTINKISKLSKKYHKPLITNPLNCATYVELNKNDIHWLDNATPFALFKAISACHSRMKGQDNFVYRIRNGKSWVKTSAVTDVNGKNYNFLIEYLKTRFDFSGTKFYVPDNVKYALPTSEKMFVGNIPTGTRFYAKKMAVGIYWENKWGANDLDLSALNIGGKVGWNSDYKQGNGSLMFSGDITDAPSGAVEYLYAKNGLNDPTLILNNVFSGLSDSTYKIIIGKGDKISRNYMMDPNNLFMETTCQSVQKQMVLGMIIPKKDEQCFVLLNFGAGNARVSGNNAHSNTATKALYQQWKRPLGFNKIVKILGGEIINEKEDGAIDLSLDNLDKNTFIKIFDKKD
ncbi:MAG: hypothetical protein H8E98_03545 [Bacteroidetes bacterium]|nr:hypothetical protein [Bacteroidota bacterium]